MAVSTHGTAGVVKVNVEVGGQPYAAEGVILNRQVADLDEDSTQILSFQVSLTLMVTLIHIFIDQPGNPFTQSTNQVIHSPSQPRNHQLIHN